MNKVYREWCLTIREILRKCGLRMIPNRAGIGNWRQIRELWQQNIPPAYIARRLIDAGMAR